MKKLIRPVKISLRQIAEAIDEIPHDGGASMFKDAASKLSTEEKKKLLALVGDFNRIGECLQESQKVADLANMLNEIARMGETYAVNECGDWFQTPALKKDWKRLREDVGEFQKVAKECFANYQQMGVLYENVGRVLQRYYEIKSSMPEVHDPTPTYPAPTPPAK